MPCHVSATSILLSEQHIPEFWLPISTLTQRDKETCFCGHAQCFECLITSQQTPSYRNQALPAYVSTSPVVTMNLNLTPALHRASDNLAALRKAYGEPHCSLLPINSGTGERGTTGAPPDFFRRFQRGCVVSGGGAGEPSSRPPPPPQGMGAHLTVQVSKGHRDQASAWRQESCTCMNNSHWTSREVKTDPAAVSLIFAGVKPSGVSGVLARRLLQTWDETGDRLRPSLQAVITTALTTSVQTPFMARDVMLNAMLHFYVYVFRAGWPTQGAQFKDSSR